MCCELDASLHPLLTLFGGSSPAQVFSRVKYHRGRLGRLGRLCRSIFGTDLPEEQRKPHAWPALEALRTFGLDAADAVMLDDLSPGPTAGFQRN